MLAFVVILSKNKQKQAKTKKLLCAFIRLVEPLLRRLSLWNSLQNFNHNPFEILFSWYVFNLFFRCSVLGSRYFSQNFTWSALDMDCWGWAKRMSTMTIVVVSVWVFSRENRLLKLKKIRKKNISHEYGWNNGYQLM